MTQVFSLESYLMNKMFIFPMWKEPFIREFSFPKQYDKRYLNPKHFTFKLKGYGRKDAEHSRRVLLFNRLEERTLDELRQLPHYDEVVGLHELLSSFLWKHEINNKWYNTIFSLSMFIDDIIDDLKKTHTSFIPHKRSKVFLNYALNHEVPYEYLKYLSVLLAIEETELTLKRIKDPEKGRKIKLEVEGMTDLKQYAHRELWKYIQPIKQVERIVGDFKGVVSHGHVFISDKKLHYIEFIDKDGGRSFLIFGDGGAGKTILTLRMMYSAWKQGFTVLLFAKDIRGEVPYWTAPMTQISNRNIWEILIDKQGEKTQGFPITTHCEEPMLWCEQDIKKFRGTKNVWDEMKDIHFFKSRQVKVLTSFMKYRAMDTSKDFLIVMNEAHQLLKTMGKKGRDWFKAVQTGDLFMEWRGADVPVILNTRLTNWIPRETKTHISEIYTSYYQDERSRKEVEKLIGLKDVVKYISDRTLYDNKVFVRYCDAELSLVRSLIPPCMIKNRKYEVTPKGIQLIK